MKKFTKSILTALSLATATFSVAPQAAGLTKAATASKTTKEFKDGSYYVTAKINDIADTVYSTEASFLTGAATKVTIKSSKISAVSFTLDADLPAYSNLTINGQKAKVAKAKDGSVTYTFAASAYKTSKGTISFTVNDKKVTADITFSDLPASAYNTVVETSTVAKKTVKKNSAVYDRNGKKTKAKSIKAGKVITTYGILTRNGVKYYKVSKKTSQYIKASNVDGVFVTLKQSAAVYTKALKKTKTTYKKGKKLYAYAYAMLGGNKYYKLGTDKYIPASAVDGYNITLKHGAVVYTKDLKKTKTSYKEGKKLYAYGSAVLNKRKYYQVGSNSFVVASNVDGTNRKLKKNAYIYKKSKGKAVRYKKFVLKKNSTHKTYGSAVKIKGKKYYIVGVGQYVVKSNFR